MKQIIQLAILMALFFATLFLGLSESESLLVLAISKLVAIICGLVFYVLTIKWRPNYYIKKINDFCQE